MGECENGYRRIQTVYLFVINGTNKIFTEIKNEPCSEGVGPIVAAIFLALIFLAAVLLSTMVLVTIATSYTLRKYLYSSVIMNICCVVLLDCLLNLTVAVAYAPTAPWQFGYTACKLNSFFMLFITLEMILALGLFALDRLLVLKKFATYLSLSKTKLALVIILTWVISLAFCLPILIDFTSLPYKLRYSCSVADPRDDEYLIVPLIVVVLIPAFGLFIILVVTVVIFDKEKKKQKKTKGGQAYSYLDQILMTPYYRNEIYPSICMGVLVIALLILWLPNAVVITFTPLMTEDWFNQSSLARFKNSEEFPKTNGTNMTAADAERRNNTAPVPEIETQDYYETVFIWFRFVFDMLVPIIIFITLKDIRLKCSALICVCRPETIDAASPQHKSSSFIKTPKSSGFAELKYTNKKPKESKTNMVSYTTPVLFVTDDGLHIRTADESFSESQDLKSILGFNKSSNPEPKFCIEACDIVMPSEEFTDFEGEFDISEEIIPETAPHSPQGMSKDDYEEEKSFSEQVIMGANRALMARKTEEEAEQNAANEEREVKSGGSKPSSGKSDGKPSNEKLFPDDEKEEVESKFDETIDLDEQKPEPKAAKKHVRFDTKNLIQSIPRPRDSASSMDGEDFDTASINSNDSGVWADSELDDYSADNLKAPAKKYRPKRVIHNVRNSQPLVPAKKSSGYGRLNKSPPRKKMSKNKVDPNVGGAMPRKKMPGTPRLDNVKSRYMDHYKKMNASAKKSKVSAK